MNDYELLQAFRTERSEEAFAELVRRYAGLVYSVAKRRLANVALAEDITQIVFIRFAKTPPRVRNHAELAAWLHRTAVHVTIDMWRSENRRRNREQQAIVMESTTPEHALWEDISPNLDEALNQLNADDRHALLLRFFARKAMREVGAALGVSEDAAKMRVSRAIDRLRSQLGVRYAACTAAMLGTLLADRSLEAAPVQLVSRLAAMRLPVAAGIAGTGGLLGAFLRMSRFKLAAGAAVIMVIGVSAFHLIQSSNPPTSRVVNPEINQTRAATGSANHRKFGTRSLDLPAASLPPRPVKMLFHVVDAETGDGLADATIHVAYFGAGGMGEGQDVTTDNNGVAAIPEPNDATKNHPPNVFVVAAAHVPKAVNFHGSEIPADYTIKLDPAMTVGGLIADEQGAPVADVKIMIQGPGNVDGQAENVDFQTCPVTNHADGNWTCSYIPRDYTNEIRFILKKPGYAVTFPWVPAAKVDLTNLVLVINRGFTVTGEIMDSQNHPIRNARVRVITGEVDKRQSDSTDENGVFTLTGISGETESYVEPALETNANGGFVIRGLVGQGLPHVELAVQADEFAAQTATVKLLAPTNVANFTLLPGNFFRGRVVDEAGNPIANAVAQTDVGNQGFRAFEWHSRTGADGRFEWDSAPEGPVLFWFEAEGYPPQRDVLLAADGSDHEIVLKHAATK